jgi:hypothetical protein
MQKAQKLPSTMENSVKMEIVRNNKVSDKSGVLEETKLCFCWTHPVHPQRLPVVFDQNPLRCRGPRRHFGPFMLSACCETRKSGPCCPFTFFVIAVDFF